MWEAIERLSWLAGILSLVVAVLGAPKVVVSIRSAKQWLTLALSISLFACAVLILIRYEPFVNQVAFFFRKVEISLPDYTGLSEAAALTCAVLISGAALGLCLLPSKIAGLRAERIIYAYSPVVKLIQRKFPRDRQRLALEIQRLQNAVPFNPSLAVVHVCVASAVTCAGVFFLVQYLPAKSVPGVATNILPTVLLSLLAIALRIGVVARSEDLIGSDRPWLGKHRAYGTFGVLGFLVVAALYGSDNRIQAAVIAYYAVQLVYLLNPRMDRMMTVDRAKIKAMSAKYE